MGESTDPGADRAAGPDEASAHSLDALGDLLAALAGQRVNPRSAAAKLL